MILEHDVLRLHVLAVVFLIDEGSDFICAWLALSREVKPDFQSKAFFARETLIDYSCSYYFLRVRESFGNDVENYCFPNSTQLF